MQKIRKGDKVVILTGKDKGRSGEVLQVMPKEDRAVVRGINIVKRHQRQDADHATVEFVARSKLGGRAHRLHEVSRFERIDGRWYYRDGDLSPSR